MGLEWGWYTFNDMSPHLLYGVLRLRQQVFVVEQACAYLDCDDRDQFCRHLVGWRSGNQPTQPLAYLRLIPPDAKGVRIGRILTHSAVRGQGYGRELLDRVLAYCGRFYPKEIVRISAQQYLSVWYTGFGFQQTGPPYDEDGIAHVEMALIASHRK